MQRNFEQYGTAKKLMPTDHSVQAMQALASTLLAA
jgi:hypothetical protein